MVHCHDIFWFSDAAMASLVMAQTLVMVSVFCRSRHSLVMPWKILQIGEPGRTVEQFFHDVAWTKIQSTSSTTIELISAYLGRSKESLDEIELSIRLDLAVATYGGYFRYVISQTERNEPKQAVNAFAMLMASQRQLCQQRLPEKRTEHNSRDRLYNAILDLLSEKKLSFPSDEVDHSGVNLVKSLQECLWYIDGQHSVFVQQSCHIPAVFSQFVNYNVPKKSKHRKRQICNTMFFLVSTDRCSAFFKHHSGSKRSGSSSMQTSSHSPGASHNTVTT